MTDSTSGSAASDRSHIVQAGAVVDRLEVADVFTRLTAKEQLYAHHMARAAWHGARIILRQTSPEAEQIFDLIMSLYRRCQGDWVKLGQDLNLAQSEVDAFCCYAAFFLSNIGNYYGFGDQKFVPDVTTETLRTLCHASVDDGDAEGHLQRAMVAVPPYSLGYPSENAQSTYYPGTQLLSEDEISTVARIMESEGIRPENTRLSKSYDETGNPVFTVLQASTISDSRVIRTAGLPPSSSHPSTEERNVTFVIERGDYKDQLLKVCSEMRSAMQYAANDVQQRILELQIASFESGNLESYRDGLKLWVRDIVPAVEHVMGFVETYRDPHGIRAEFDGLVGVADPQETKTLAKLAENCDAFIKELPWCIGHETNGGKGPFEKTLFELPDFSSIYMIAYCTSTTFPATNLPNYRDIREECGFKNIIIANRMATEASGASTPPYIADTELATFLKHHFTAYYIWVVLHELIGHGTGKMLSQSADGTYNFDHRNAPVNPLTQKPVAIWYQPGQTFAGQFKDLAAAVEECRADLAGAYLMGNKDVLAIFGHTDSTNITADDLTYNLYMQLAVEGLRGLEHFNVDNMTWGQAHGRGNFAILKCLIRDGAGCIRIESDPKRQRLTIHVDRSKIIPHGHVAIGHALLHLHMYQSTADVASCRDYFEDLSSVEGEYLEWRSAVLSTPRQQPIFLQPNTFLENGQVRLKQYEATYVGMIESWAERAV